MAKYFQKYYRSTHQNIYQNKLRHLSFLLSAHQHNQVLMQGKLNYNLIRYNAWESVEGLILPKEITWYKKDDNGMPTEPARPATKFTLPLISKAKLADSFFEKPKN